MDPRALLHPIGPLPPRVYWLRRMLVLIPLVIIIVAIAVATSGSSSSPNAAGSRTRTPAVSSQPPSPVSTPACSSTDLTVTPTTDATTYPSGVLPHLSVTIRNDGSEACRFAESATTLAWSIYSGTDQLWTTAGCASTAHRGTHTLAVHHSIRRELVWNRHRSLPKCETSSTAADPGTYRLYVTVRGHRSPAAVFHLTG